MAYSIVCKLNLKKKLSADDAGILLTSAVCHDVDHPGLNNTFQTNAKSPLAILYNYESILEQHHFAVTCRILSSDESNILSNVPHRDVILRTMAELILATDLAKHKSIVEVYSKCVDDGFNFNNSLHKTSLLKLIIKCADISNEVRPESVSNQWVTLLFTEYALQTDCEKREKLPVTPYMDPANVVVSKSQEGFIKGVMLPMYSELCKIDDALARNHFVNPLKDSLLRYELENIRQK